MFQSTRPRGARPKSDAAQNVGGCFNPRAREGRDESHSLRTNGEGRVSIHAPARGATQLFRPYLLFNLFQSTRPRGARRRACICAPVSARFNPRAREGRDTT